MKRDQPPRAANAWEAFKELNNINSDKDSTEDSDEEPG